MANKARPKTGEKRKTNQPLKIDLLPPAVHDAILKLRARDGKTWQEIEALSALPKDKGGFIDWENLSTAVLEMFPDMRLAHTSLHRWHDLRVAQVRDDVMRRSEQARQIAEAFASSVVENGDEAVVNAARDTIMAILAEDASSGGRAKAAKMLIVLADVMQAARANDIKERKVATEEKKVRMLEERETILKRKLEREAAELERKRSSGELKQEDIARLVEMTFGIAPQPPKAA